MRVSRRLFGVIVAAVACLWCFGGLVASGEGAVGRDRRDHERRPQRYYVLQVLGVGGQVTFEVASDLDYAKRRKDYQEEFDKAKLDWLKSKAEAKKNKQEFKEPPPKGPQLMEKLTPSFKKEEEARADAEKRQKQWDEKLEKALAKKAEAEAKQEKKTEEK